MTDPRTALFGGTFDPPHVGHLGVVEAALASGEVDEVWLVPCMVHRFAKQPAGFRHRLAMCRLLVEGVVGARVSDIEVHLERPGFTLDLVQRMRADHPRRDLRLLAGADIYHERDQWHRYEDVARLAPPLYVARGGVDAIPLPVLPAPPAVSSSELRGALARGERPTELVPAAVLAYIEEHQIYRGSS